MSRFILLDRDGVLVRDTDYPHKPEHYELLPGVIEGLQALRDAGYAFAIVTNQSGIGRGYYDEAAFRRFQQLLLDDLTAGDIEIADTFFCPHVPDAGCACRKPEPGLFFQARDALGFDLAESWLIGDHARDIQAGQAAGCGGVVFVGAASEAVEDAVPHCADLRAAAQLILSRQA